MSRMRKVLLSVLSTLFLICLSLAAVSCGDEIKINKAENTYEYSYTTDYDGENDPNITIDGKLDESVWTDKKWFANHFYADLNNTMPAFSVTAFTTEYGVYMGVKVQDDNIIYSGQMHQAKNSTLEFYYYVHETDTVIADKDWTLRHAFMLDYGGEMYSTCERMKRAITIDGIINSGATVGAVFELFVPWSELRIDATADAYPQKVFLYPFYRPVLKGSTSQTPLWTVPLSPLNHMKNYYEFDANGYTDVDAPDAVVGDSYNGVAKTGNWDLEKLDEGVLSISTGEEFNSIFFRNALTESFTAEVTMYPISGSSKYTGHSAGFFIMGTNGNYYAMMLDMRAARLTQAQDGGNALNAYSLITLTEAHQYWEQITKTTVDNPAFADGETPGTSGVRFKILKAEDTIHYFVDGQYLYSEKLDFIMGNVYAGLFNLNTYIDYKEYSFTALNEQELSAELNSLDIYKLEAVTSTVGGYVELENDYVVGGANVGAMIVSDSGYAVSSVLYNGEDITETVRANAVNGVYTLENITEDIQLTVSFERLEKAVTYKGYLMDGASIGGAITIVGKTDSAQRYEIVASADRGFEAKLKAGEYTVFVGNYLGGIPVSLTEDLTENIQLTDKPYLASSDIRHMNFDFVNRSANTVPGQVTQWFVFQNASDSAYIAADFYNYDLDGFSVEANGENVQFYLSEEGLCVLRNYTWDLIPTVAWRKYAIYRSATGQKILNPGKVDYLDGARVEMAVSDGRLYVAIDGIGKANLLLSEFNAAFTADAEYKVGFCTYDGRHSRYPVGGARYENIDAAFGKQARSQIENIVGLCTATPYDLGTALYNDTSVTSVGDYVLFAADDAGAEVFDDVEIPYGQSFMVEAEIEYVYAQGVGFVVGTLGNTNENHVLFNWRPGHKDIYVSREEESGVWKWRGFDGTPYPCNYALSEGTVKMMLVYSNGRYYMFFNGELMMSIHEDTTFSWSTDTVGGIVGTSGNVKVGLSVLYGAAAVVDWGYTTDAAKIAAFLGSLAKPIVDTDIYSSATSIYQNGELTLSSANNGAFFFEGIEIEQDADFMIYAELSKEALVAGGGVGFVVGTRGDANANHVLFNWRPGQKDIYVSREKNGEAWGWKGFETSPSCNVEKSEETIKMTLIYKKGTYYMFLNDTKVLEISETTKFSWSSDTIADIVGETGTVKVGLSTIFGSATFTDWGYTTDATEITQYVTE